LLEIKIKLLGSLGARAGAQNFKSRTNVGLTTLNPIGLRQNLCKSHRDQARSEIRTSFIVLGSDQLNIGPDLISVMSVYNQNPTQPARLPTLIEDDLAGSGEDNDEYGREDSLDM